MSAKKQFPNLRNFNSLYEEKPEEFLDETDVDCFFTTFVTIPSPSIEWCELPEAPTKKCLESSCSSFAI